MIYEQKYKVYVDHMLHHVNKVLLNTSEDLSLLDQLLRKAVLRMACGNSRKD